MAGHTVEIEVRCVPIVECGSRFTAPVRYGDTMKVTSTIAWVARPGSPGERLQARAIPSEVVARLTS